MAAAIEDTACYAADACRMDGTCPNHVNCLLAGPDDDAGGE